MLFAVLVFTPGIAHAQDWLLNYEDATDPVPAGGTVDYPATVTNNGAAAPATFIELDVPSLTTLTNVISPGTGNAIDNCRVVAAGATAPFAGGSALPAVPGDRVICDVPALGFLETASFTPQYLTSAPAAPPESYQLTISVLDPTGVDTSLTNNTLVETTTVAAGADLGVETVFTSGAVAGGRVTFDVTVENFGPNTSNGYSFTFSIPTGLADVTLPAGCNQAGGTVTCTVNDPLALGESDVFSFDALVATGAGSDISVSATVDGTSPSDPVGSNDTDDDQIIVTGGTDVSVEISRDTGFEVLSNTPVTFTLSPEYTGDPPDTVTVTHTVPAGFTFVPGDIVAPGWTVSVNGNDLTFTQTVGAGAVAGQNVSLGDITIPTTAVTPGDETSVVNVTSTGPVDQNPANNTDQITTRIVAPVIDLVADKRGPDPALAVVGQNYDFVLDVRNAGNAPFFGDELIVRDIIPDAFQFVAASGPGWTCALVAPPGAVPAGASGIVECTRSDYTQASPLAPGADAPLINIELQAVSEGSVSNRMEIETVNPSFPDSNPGNDDDDFGITSAQPGASADITVNKSVAEGTLTAGELQTYTLELVNQDLTQTSFDVTLTDRFTNLINSRNNAANGPPGFDNFLISDPSGIATNLACTSAASGGTTRVLTCTADALAPCTAGVDCPTVTVQVRHGTDADPVTNTADIISETTPDPDLGNNDSSTSFTQNPITEITVTKTVSAPSVAAGQNVTFIVTGSVDSEGRSSAEDFTITDRLPVGMRFISAVSPQGTCTIPFSEGDIIPAAPNNEIVCDYGTVGDNRQRTLTVTLQPTNDQIGGGALVNEAEVTTSTPQLGADPTVGDLTDTASAQTTVEDPITDILINKDDTVDPLPIGDNTVYEIEVVNGGPSTSEDIVVTDTLPPAGLEYVGFTIAAPGACDDSGVNANGVGGEVVCTWPSLLEGESFEIFIEMRGIESGDYPNSVEVSSFEILNGFDADALNNTNTENTTIRTVTDVSMPSKVPSATDVSVLEEFTYDITVVVAAGVGAAEDLTVTDDLPAGMELTGAPTSPFLANACTGAAGDTDFVCSFGDVPADTTIVITVPVQIVTTTSSPQTFTNTAEVTVANFDQSIGNDEASGDVTVVSSSLAGTVFRDFDNSGTQDLPGDTGVDGVTMTLVGTETATGDTFTRTVQTDVDGNYLFPDLPGDGFTYVVTRGDPADPNFTDGIDTPGSEGGTAVGPDQITGISIPDGVDAVDYDFAIIPGASIGLSKDLADQIVNPDFSYTATFDLVVENLSAEPLINVAVTDPLEGGSPLFGTLVTPADPANDPLAPGTYTIVTAPGGSCGGLNGGFNGAGDQTLASGFGLAIDGSCTVSFTIRVQPTVPEPPVLASGAQYENQATVVGVGSFSGSDVTDLSDDGADPDTNDNGVGNEAGENDPTPLTVGAQPGIELEKIITDATSLEDGAQVGDQIFYSFTVTNTGEVPLRDVVVEDLLPGVVVSGGPTIPLLNPTDVDDTTFTGVYSLVQGDVDAGGTVVNTARVSGTYGPLGTPLVVTDEDTVTATPPNPADGLSITKTVDPEVVRRGTLVFYTIVLSNDNPFDAFGIDIVDTLPEGLIYQEGTAQLDGVDAVIELDGQVVTFPDVDVAAGTEVIATLQARILNSANPGEYVNSVLALDPPLGILAGPATATVRLLPEAVFDCSDVIGRVFDDLDGDGYQDAYDPNAIPEDTDPDGKIEEVAVRTDEVGLPNVRLVTLDGLVITTDQNGLFSVPCAALPADIGSNFLLSLDERTLPLGYEMTTQNPRVMRLTPGTLTEMNFGARLAQVMRVDLSIAAFGHGAVVSPEMRNAVGSMVTRLNEEPSTVELVFHVPANASASDVAFARAAMEALTDEIQSQWGGVGSGQLRIEQVIARGGN